VIITVAGTSGAGKSYLMRSFLAWARKNGTEEVQHVDGREAPIGYLFDLKKKLKHNVFIPGHYEAPTGGCDTIHDVEQVFELVKNMSAQGVHVLYEGLFVMNMTRGPRLVQELDVPFYVLQLTTPLAACIASIDERRAERGEGKLQTKTNTVGNYGRATNYCAKMRDAGARVVKVDRQAALPKLLELLGA